MQQDKMIEAMRQRWGERTPGYLPRLKGKSKAVLIPLIQTEKGLEVVYEIRATTLRTQPCEVSFPGGGIEAGETPEQAAVRETCEELLMTPENVEILAPMDGENAPTLCRQAQPLQGNLFQGRGRRNFHRAAELAA